MADLEHVPTVEEVAKLGLARGIEYNKAGKPGWYELSPEGMALMTGPMMRNGKKLRAELDKATKPVS